MALRTGLQPSPSQVAGLIASLDEALLLEDGSFGRVSARALQRYRNAESRETSHAGVVYPADPGELARSLDEYLAKAPDDALPSSATLTGVESPHIDYQRGGETYARLWKMCGPALDEVELVVILGTDHSGSPGALTLTRQTYATPLGVLPTDLELVDGLAEALGPERAFAEELHHISEHSIELAAVWLHHYLGGRDCPVVPVLCGSFFEYINGELEPDEDEGFAAAVGYLGEVMARRRTLVVAAADLAHVGPAFGDPSPVDPAGRAALAAQDARSIAAICKGDADGFFRLSRSELDRRKICGLSPIYLALKLLGPSAGRSVGYAQCPADVAGGSFVSIVGAALWSEEV
jgi:AmmeMemoRadiSam system protein B